MKSKQDIQKQDIDNQDIQESYFKAQIEQLAISLAKQRSAEFAAMQPNEYIVLEADVTNRAAKMRDFIVVMKHPSNLFVGMAFISFRDADLAIIGKEYVHDYVAAFAIQGHAQALIELDVDTFNVIGREFFGERTVN